MIKQLRIFAYLSRILHPNYPPYYFPIYMFILYLKIKALEKPFRLYVVPSILIRKLMLKSRIVIFDVDNTVCIPDKHFKGCNFTSFATLDLNGWKKIVQTISYKTEPSDTILISETLHYNLNYQNIATIKPLLKPHFVLAKEIDLSLINTYCDVNNTIIDTAIRTYFKNPKLMNNKDLIEVDIKDFAPEFFYTHLKSNKLQTLYFKCNKIDGNKGLTLCISGQTALKQSPNIQCDLPKKSATFTNIFHNKIEESLIPILPFGFEEFYNDIERSIAIFIKNEKLNLRPVFLIRGNKGVGKKKIVECLSQKLGFHLNSVNSCEINSSAYAQTEIKLSSCFFKAKLCTPCIFHISNFEHIGKNNEGVHDARLISCFIKQLDNLFANNSHPLILICTANCEIPPELSRVFLETFEMSLPNDNQRVRLLEWFAKKINLTCDNWEGIARKSHGFSYADIEALIYHTVVKNRGETDLSIDQFDKPMKRMQANFGKSLGTPRIPQVQWSDVGGLGDVKHEIIRTINLPLRHPELIKKSGLKRSGILLYGPPGTGKTLIAKAVATECSLHFLSVKGPELLNMYVGQSEQNVREVFERAREASPCIIFFDELDALAPNRGISGDSGGVMDRVVSQLLAEMDGLNQSGTIFIIGATNRPDLIDQALLRPGRFDKLLYVGPCTDFQSKLDVLKAQTRRFKLSPSINLEDVVKMTASDVTGADFYGVCSNAWMSAARRLVEAIENGLVNNPERMSHNNVVVQMEDFEEAVENLKPSIKSSDLEYFDKLRRELGNKQTK